MTFATRRIHVVVVAAVFAAAFLAGPQLSAAPGAAQQHSATENAAARLHKSQFKNVKVSVDNGIATLTGTVALYEFKTDAARRVVQAKGVTGVRNLIQVAGPDVPDAKLQSKLRDMLAYDFVGWGIGFDAIGVTVHNGVVTVSGHAHTPWNADSAMALIASTPGVKDIVGNIEVDPVSPMDNQIRLAVARAIYGYPPLQKYAIDPARPIRISVQNGNVELYGTVDSQVDRQMAYMRASSVPGVFSVKNYILVAGQPAKAKK